MKHLQVLVVLMVYLMPISKCDSGVHPNTDIITIIKQILKRLDTMDERVEGLQKTVKSDRENTEKKLRELQGEIQTNKENSDTKFRELERLVQNNKENTDKNFKVLEKAVTSVKETEEKNINELKENIETQKGKTEKTIKSLSEKTKQNFTLVVKKTEVEEQHIEENARAVRNVERWMGEDYLFVDEEKTWSAAEQYCRERNRHLVSITSPEKNDFVWNVLMRRTGVIWTGLTDAREESHWMWTNPRYKFSKTSYSRWHKSTHEPNGGRAENCMTIGDFSSVDWNDLSCSNQKKFVCEQRDASYCPDFDYGDGRGVSEEHISSSLTGNACIKECVKRRKTDSSINGVTVLRNGQGGCWCEKYMNSVWRWDSSLKTYKTCLLIPEIQYCPEFEFGDGWGSSEEYISSSLTGTPCIKECVKRREEDSSINGVTLLRNGHGGCWCEKNMNSVSKDDHHFKSYKTCLLS